MWVAWARVRTVFAPRAAHPCRGGALQPAPWNSARTCRRQLLGFSEWEEQVGCHDCCRVLSWHDGLPASPHEQAKPGKRC